MMPLVNTTSSFTTPPPLVNTTTPGTNVAHVPYDNVAPSVSSAQVDNNARGNSAPAATQNQQAAPPQANAPGASSFAVALDTSNRAFTSTAPATFLAQLMGQDLSPEAKAVLVQYEKLVAFGNVKYMPSNAFKPEAEPSNIFGRILQSERSAPPRPAPEIVTPPVTLASSPNASQSISVAAGINALNDIQQAQRNNKPAASDASDEPDFTDSPVVTPNPASQTPPRVINAYLATAARVGSNNGADATAEVA